MTYRINYNGTYQDYIDIIGESLKEIREKAFEECKNRGWKQEDCWSEKID